MIVINNKSISNNAKKKLQYALIGLETRQESLNKAVDYASSDRVSFDKEERDSLYNSAKNHVDRLNTLSTLLRENRDLYVGEYGEDYVNNLTKYASQGSQYGKIAEAVKSKNSYLEQFADENDYKNYQTYGRLTRPMLKTVSEKLEKDYGTAKKLGDTTAMETAKSSLAWVNNRLKSMTDVGSMSLEEMQGEKERSTNHKSKVSDLIREKADAEAMLQLMESTKLADQQNGTFDEEKYEQLKKQVGELETITNSDIAYFDQDGNAITWDKAIDTKIRGMHSEMSLEELEKKRAEAEKNIESSKTKFLGITMPSGETTDAKEAFNAWDAAYQVKKGTVLKNNADWSEKSKAIQQDWSFSHDNVYDYINNIDNLRSVSDSNALEAAGLDESVLKYQQMTPDEIGAYNYIYATEGREKAEEYLKALSTDLNYRTYKADVTRQSQLNGWELTGENALSVARNTLDAVPAALSTVGKWATNTPIDPYSSDYRALNMSDTTRAETSRRIQDNIGGVGGDVVDFLYGTAMSGLDSAATIPINMIIPGSGLVIMGSRAGVSATNEAIKKGVSQDKAMLTGLLAGGFEAAFEKIPLDRLTDVLKNGKKATSGIFKTLLKEGGINAGEELLTSLSNEMADRVINGDLSNYAVSVERYKLQGLPTEEARKKANTDFALQLAQDAAAGFLQGFTMTAGANAINTAYNKSAGDNIVKNKNVGKLVEKAKSLNGSEELNSLISEVEGFDTEKLSGKQKATIGKLYNVALNEAQATASDSRASDTSINNAVVERLIALKSNNVEASANAVVKTLTGQKLTAAENQAIKNDVAAQKVIAEAENAGSQDYTSEWAGNMISTITAEQTERVNLFRDIQSLANVTTENAVTGQQKVKASGIAVNPQNIDTYTEDGEVVNSAVKSLKTAQNGNILVEFEDGNTKALSEVELSETAAEVVAYAKDYGEYANVFLQTYKQGATESVDEFAKEFNYAVESGKIGATLDYVQNSGYTKNLSPTQIQNAWEVGRQMSEAEARNGSVATYEEYQANKKAGKVTVDKSINTKRLNRNQISAMYAIRGIARATGINIVIENKGLVRETNGAYDPNTNTIHIDINAGKYGLNFGEYAMLRTLSHELTHYIRENNKAAYKQLQDFIFSKLSDYKGKSIDELVEAEQYGDMDFDDAAEEVVARACEMMLRDSAAIEALYYENRGLFDTIKNFIVGFKKAVYKAFDRVGARSEAAKAMLQYADELQALWDNALVGAVHNQQGKGNVAQGEQVVKLETSDDGMLTEEQYNNFGWVRYNDVLSASEYSTLLSRYADYKHNKHSYPTTKTGEAVIYAFDYPNVIMYVKGKIDNPKITMILEIEPMLPVEIQSKIQKEIIVNESKQVLLPWENVTDIFGEGILTTHKKKNKLSFQEYRGRKKRSVGKENNPVVGNEQERTRSSRQSEKRYGTDNLNPTDNPDIRYERAEITEDEVISQSKKAMAAELTRLRELLKMQGRESHGTVFTKSSVDSVAAELIKKSDSRLTKAELAPLLQKLYARIASDKELNFEDVMDEARGIADKINEGVRQRKFQDPYKKEIRDYLRKNRILITEEALAEGRFHYGGAKEFYNAWRGKLKFTTTDKSALPIDTLWKEAQGLYGDYFDSNVTIESEMAYKLVEIYDQLNDDAEASKFAEYYKDEIREQTAYDIYDGFWRVNTLHTVADKYAKEIRQLKSSHQTKIEGLRAERDQIIKDLKSGNREKVKSIYEKRDKANEIRSITKKVNSLYKKLKENSAKNHIPEPLKEPLANFLMSLDFSSEALIDRQKQLKSDEKFSKRLIELNNILKNYTSVTQKSVESIIDLSDEITTELDELYKAIEKKFPEGKSFTINKMSADELKTLRKCITEISKAINNADKTLSGITTQRISELGYETIDDLEDMETYQPFTEGRLKTISTFAKWDLKIPFYAFKLFGKGGKTIFKGLMKGWGDFARNIKAITDFTENAYTEKEVQRWKSNVQTYHLSGGDLQMTDTIAMYLYVAVKREQARRHLFGAGLAVEEFKSKGKLRNVAQKGQHFSIEDIAEIESHLTERQKEIANKLQQFMGEECAEWGNTVSMKRYGINMFTEKNYIPIKTLEGGDGVSDKDADRSLYRLLNLSFTKATTIKANNSLVARDIFDVFTEHTTDMAKYNALALPVLDAIRWANFKETVDDGSDIDIKSVRKALDNAYGTDAMTYIDNFLKSLSGVKDGGVSRVEGFLKGFLKNFKIAAVAGNLRVAFLQLTSYVRAGAVLSQKSLTAANFKKLPSNDLVNKYCGMALWKSMGYYDINVARSVREQIAKKSNIKDKIVEKSLWLTSKADEYTLRKLWSACEYEISKQRPELKKGSEEYNKAVGEKLDEVIFATQVVDSTITRAPVMREKSATMQQMSAFMSEPLVTLNVMTDGYLEMHNDIKKGMLKPKAIAKHSKRLMKLSGIFFTQAILTSVLEGLWDAWRDDDDDEYIEKFLRAIPNNVYENINLVNQAPIFSDILEGFENRLILPWAEKYGQRENAELIFGKDYSQNSKSEFVQFYYDITDAAKKWSKIASGESDNYYGAIYKTATALSRTVGIPISNVLREGVSLYNNIVDFIGNEDLKIRTYEPSTADKWDSYDRYFENKDMAKANKVIDDMIAEKTEKYISEGATKQEAKAKASTSVRSSFTRRYKKLYQEAYKAKDTEECARIYRLVQASKLYPNSRATIYSWKQID